MRAVCAELRRRHGWLLIFDNAEDIDHIRPVLPGGAGHVLITTRRGGFGYLGPVLDLDVLPRPEARHPAAATGHPGSPTTTSTSLLSCSVTCRWPWSRPPRLVVR